MITKISDSEKIINELNTHINKISEKSKLPEHRGLSTESIQYACEKNSIN